MDDGARSAPAARTIDGDRAPAAALSGARGRAAAPGAPRYLLVCNTSDGLVAQLNGVLVQLQLARRLGLEPIVHLHKRSFMFGGPNPYYQEEHGPNVWDYYYEPVGASASELASLVARGEVVTLTCASELARLHRWEPRSFHMNPYGYYRSVENRADGPYPHDWWRAQREKARVFLRDGTIRFRKHILDEVDRFVEREFSEETLGLQLRGSDKFDFGTGSNLARKVLPEEYFSHIDRYLAEHPKCARIFVATDQRQWLKVLQAAYPDHVISFSQWSLSDSDENNFHAQDEKASRGAEVLVDALLLSRCSYLIKCHAAVGELALVLNPELDFVDLNYAEQPFAARYRLPRWALAPGIKAACAAWSALAERGMALTKVVSVDEDRIMVGGPAPRPLNTKESVAHRADKPPLLSGRFVSDALRWCLHAVSQRCLAYEEKPRITSARPTSPGR